MKIRNFIFIITALTAGLCCPVQSAQTQNYQAQTGTSSGFWGSTEHAKSLGVVDKAKQLLGREVRDSQNHKVGKIEDLAVDLHNGRLVEAIIDASGYANARKSYLAVPPAILSDDPSQKVVQLNVDPARLNNAPQFTISSWSEFTQPNQVTEVYRYYGQVNELAAPQPSSSVAVAQNQNNNLGMVESARKILGTQVKNTQQQNIGKVDNMVLDLTNGRVIALVVSSGGFLGLGDTLSAIPPQAFTENTADHVLQINLAKDQLAGYPHFKSSQWPNFSDPNYVAGLYQDYHVQPYFTASTSSSAATIGSGGTTTPTVSSRSSGFSHTQITSANVPFTAVERSKKLEGMTVKNLQNEKVGDVDNVVMDLKTGRVIAVVISSGGFLGIGNTLSPVPPEALQMNSTHDALVLDISKDTLASYPHFSGDQWPKFEDPNYLNSIYRAYNVTPDWEKR